MLSQKLLEEIVKKQDIYESKTYQLNGRFSERDVFDIQKISPNFERKNTLNNLGEKSISLFIM